MDYKEIFTTLPESEKLALIDKVMPCSGTHRQLEEQGNFSYLQIKWMVEFFINSISWEQIDLFEKLSFHDEIHSIRGISEIGNEYECYGTYSCDELVEIEYLTLM